MREQLSDNEMRRLRRERLEELRTNGKDPHRVTKYDVSAHVEDIRTQYETFEGREVSVAGRLMSKRGHGKIAFMDLQDATGRMQVLARFNDIGEEDYPEVKKLDIGDIVGVVGTVITTNAGEKTIQAKKICLLTKSLQLLPEKWHGLKDTDLRYRQRYVDLIVNPEVKEVFFKRTRILSEIRHFLDEKGFLEVETPILNTIAGGASARPFITHHNTLDIDMYLRIANELYLKRLIVGGFDKVYEMGRMFRNEGMDPKHNPEYTAIELYQAYTDYEGMMELTEQLVSQVCERVNGTMRVDYQGTTIDFTPPWRRVRMSEAVLEETGIDFATIDTDEQARDLAAQHHIEVSITSGKGKILSEFFEKYCEEKLIQPTFVYEYPVEISPLAKRDPHHPEMTERFEAFVYGSEIGNAFSELNDAQDQKKRFEHQVALREAGDQEANMMDYDFVNALEIGLPPTGGLGIGIDRLVMFLTNQTSIRDVLLFPTMKPLGKEAEKEDSVVSQVRTNQHEPLDLSKVRLDPLFEKFVNFEEFSASDFRVVKVKACEEVPKSKKLLKFTLDDGTPTPRTILSGIKEYYSAESLVGKTLLAICNLPPRKMMGEESQGMLLSAIYTYEEEERLELIQLNDQLPAGAKLY